MPSNPSPHSADEPVTVLAGGEVLTMDGQREILVNGGVAFSPGGILAVGPARDVLDRFAGAEVVDTTGSVVTPGLVNTHQHLTGDRLAHSMIPDDIGSEESIFGWAVPLHSHHTADDDEISATLSCVESLLEGVTTVVEAGTVAHPERVADAMEATGIRGAVSTWGWDLAPGPGSGPLKEVLTRQREAAAIERDGGRIRGWVALVGHDLVSDELFVGAAELAREIGTRLTFHMSPTPADAVSYRRRGVGRPLVHLHRLGVLGPETVVAHAVHVDRAEVDALAASGAAVAYCPWAYLRLAQGVTGAGRHHRMMDQGVRVGIGCDSENASDSLSVMRAAVLGVGLARDMTADPEAMGAWDALEWATARGGEVLGGHRTVGILAPGAVADVVVHRTDGPWWWPRGDTAQQLAWSDGGRSVSDVWVGGRRVVAEGRCLTVDTELLRDRARAASRDLLARAGLGG